MMNNPMMQLIGLVQNGRNPMGIIQQLSQNNPQVNQALTMMKGKDSRQLRQMAENMARERGIDLGQMMLQMGLRR